MSSGRLRQGAIVQVVLEGVALPARKRDLIAYARRQSPPGQILAVLEQIPDRVYALLDEVGETIAETQPKIGPKPAHEPKPESGEVPGGSAYLVLARKLARARSGHGKPRKQAAPRARST